MNINGTEVQIMWKEIAVGLLVLYVIRLLIDLYIKTEYKQINNLFYSKKVMEETLKKIRFIFFENNKKYFLSGQLELKQMQKIAEHYMDLVM